MNTYEWRPIETAPKDGTMVDLWVANWKPNGMRVTNCFWARAANCWKLDILAIGYDPLPEITHWMPLPEPPK